MLELKKVLTHKRKLPSFINKHFNIEELETLIANLTVLNNDRKIKAQEEKDKEQAVQDLALNITLELKKHNIEPYQLIQHLRNQST